MRNRHARLVGVTLVAGLAVVALLFLGLATVGAQGGSTPLADNVPADGPPGVIHAPAGWLLSRPGDKSAQKKVNVLIVLPAPPLADIYAAEKSTHHTLQVDANLQRSYVQSLLQGQAPVAAAAAKYGRVYAHLTTLTDGVGLTGVNAGDVDALRKLPGVGAVYVMGTLKPDLGRSVPFIGGQRVLEDFGLDGRGTTIAVIDSGIDYTHRDFGGPGTVEAYQFASSTPTVIPPPYHGLVLFPTEKIVDGYDFVGDTWTGLNPPPGVPEDLELSPDPNPLDREGHGTQVSSIAAGFGVPNSSAHGSIPASFVKPADVYTVFHGVAPAARLIVYKVGSSLLNSWDLLAMLAAFDRAADPNGDGNMNDHVDAINLSAGEGIFADDVPGQEAANRAVQAGIAVAVAAGNNLDVPFIVGSPSSAERVLSVAASTGPEPLYGLQFTAPPEAAGLVVPFIWQPWSAPLTPTVGGPLIEARTVVILPDDSARLGCPQGPNQANPFPPGSLAGKIAVIDRGSCAISVKAYMAQQAGALAVILVMYPDTPPTVFLAGDLTPTIPVVAVAYLNGQFLYEVMRAGIRLELTIGPHQVSTLADVMAEFTSRGPARFGNPKPDISAPGADIFSAAAGTGTGGIAVWGTSFATPHVAGSLALMKQQHPTWSPTELEAVLVNTSRPELFRPTFVTTDFEAAPISLGGAGRVDLVGAANADSVVLGDLLAHVGYGVQAIPYVFTSTKPITIENKSDTTRTYNLSATFEVTRPLPSGVEIRLDPTSVTVPAGGVGTANVTLVLRPELLRRWMLYGGRAQGLGTSLSQVEVAGFVWVDDATGGKRYHLPFYVLPRSASDVTARPPGLSLGGFELANGLPFTLANPAFYTGTVDIFHLLVDDPRDVPTNVPTQTDRLDIQYVGARLLTSTTETGEATDEVEFAVTTYAPRMLPIEAAFQVDVDLNADGTPEYIVVNTDLGRLQGKCCNGQNVVAVYDVAAGQFTEVPHYTDTNVWSTRVVMRVPASAIGLSTLRPFDVWVEAYWNFPYYTNEKERYAIPLLDRAPDAGSAVFDPARTRFIASTYHLGVARGTSEAVTVYANPAGFYPSPSELGMLLLYADNPPGAEAQIVDVTVQPRVIEIPAASAGWFDSNNVRAGYCGSSVLWAGQDTQMNPPRTLHAVADFDLSALPANATIVSAEVAFTGGDVRYLNTQRGIFNAQLLPDGAWCSRSYYFVHNASPEATLQPALTDAELGVNAANTFTFTGNALTRLQADLTRFVSIRLDGRDASPYGREIMGWYGVGGPNPPVLRVTYFAP